MTDPKDTTPKETSEAMVVTMMFDGPSRNVRINGDDAGSFSAPENAKPARTQKAISLDPTKLTGPSLKVARAKRHLAELEGGIKAFFDSNPYSLMVDADPETGEHVYRVGVHQPVPAEFSTITGDIVHNLRSALDQLVCALVRANRKQVRGGNGFPIMGSEKSFNDACVGKLKNVPIKAERFIRRLKPYKGGNHAFWVISELDNMDKHNDIVPVAAGQIHMLMRIAVPGLFMTHGGGLGIGGGPAGSVPFGYQQGWVVPDKAKVVKIVENNCEVYRAHPKLSEMPNDIQVSLDVTLGKSSVTDHEPLVETLHGLIQLVERTIHIVEKRIL